MGVVGRIFAMLLLGLFAGGAYAAPVQSLEQRLREAALAGDMPRVRVLLSYWPDVNATDREGNTALMFAACGCGPASGGDSIELMHLLLSNGADPNLKNNTGETALMIAAVRGRMDAVKLLVEHGAEARKLDLRGDTAVTLALQGGYENIAELLRTLKR